MTRWFIFSLVVAVFFICVQAAPTQEQTNANKLDDVYSKTMESLNKGIESMMKNPEVNSFLKETSQFFEKAAEKIKEEAQKLIPKTDEPAKN